MIGDAPNQQAWLARLAELNEKRLRLHEELLAVNVAIAQEFALVDAEIARLRAEFGQTKRAPLSAERKLLQSAKLRRAHARKKAAGVKWRNQYTKREGQQ